MTKSTGTTFTQKATAVRVAKKMGLKEGEFEIKLVGKGQWEIVRKEAPVAMESAPGPTTTEPTNPPPTEEASPKLEIVDYADQPKTEPTAATEAAPVATESKPERVKTSTVQNPVKFVWALAEEMKLKDPNVRRKDIVDACIAKGVAFYTAKTQVQRFLKAQKAAATP